MQRTIKPACQPRLYISVIACRETSNQRCWRQGRGTGQLVALPDEMRLIEIADLVENVGPEPLRLGKMGDQRRVETDRSRVVLG